MQCDFETCPYSLHPTQLSFSDIKVYVVSYTFQYRIRNHTQIHTHKYQYRYYRYLAKNRAINRREILCIIFVAIRPSVLISYPISSLQSNELHTREVVGPRSDMLPIRQQIFLLRRHPNSYLGFFNSGQN